MPTRSARHYGTSIQTRGAFILRYGLVLVIGWIGAMKFTAYEAAGIQPLVASSPLMRCLYHYVSGQAVAHVLGSVEVAIAVMIALLPVSAHPAALGSGLAVLMFLTTLSFFVTLPGWEPTLGGFPALSGAGGFLLKDLVFLAAAVWSLGEALDPREQRRGAR
jgi:reactive chlorine resistance protein C